MFKPNYYYKEFTDINIQLLKEQGIKVLLSDLDNTMAPYYETEANEQIKNKVLEMQKEFKVYCVSNNNEKRVKNYFKDMNIKIIAPAKKPMHKAFKTILRNENCHKNEMIMIGDQLMTDILGGSTFGIKTILVDPIVIKDEWKTKINRLIEKIIYFILKKSKKLIRGQYYENM